MAKPLQGREMSAVTISVSVSCLLVSGSAADQVSLENRLKQLQRLKIPDLFWHLKRDYYLTATKFLLLLLLL